MSGESPDLSSRPAQGTGERAMRLFFFACAVVSVLTTLGIIVALVSPAAKFFRVTGVLLGVPPEQTVPLAEFLTGTTWSPEIQPRQYGVLPLVTNTLLIVVGSAVVALPLGVATAIYLSEYASHRVRSTLKPGLEVLAGVPTVVYGYFALVYITPLFDAILPISVPIIPGWVPLLPEFLFTLPDIGTFNALSASVVVGIMIIPMVSSISEDAMSAVPDDLREAGYGMGGTKFDVSTTVVVPAAISGILSSFILALSRAVGETMAVTIAAGMTPTLANPLNPADYMQSIQPMTAAMVQLATGDISALGRSYRSLFAIGLTLFVITLAMNIISDLIAQRYREAYE